jgi:hypothetical protein
MFSTADIPLTCHCPAPLWRPVFAGHIVACMRCRTVGAFQGIYEQIPYDPLDRSRLVGFEPVVLSPALIPWLGAWARRVGDPFETFAYPEGVAFLPATLVCDDEAALARAEADARADAAPRIDDRLRAAGVPAGPPPESLPSGFSYVQKTWEALNMPADLSTEARLARARYVPPPASWFFAARMPAIDVLVAAVASLCGDPDTERRKLGVDSLNVLKFLTRNEGTFTLPDAIITSVAARLAAMDAPGDAKDRWYLANVLSAFDANAVGRVREALGPLAAARLAE